MDEESSTSGFQQKKITARHATAKYPRYQTKTQGEERVLSLNAMKEVGQQRRGNHLDLNIDFPLKAPKKRRSSVAAGVDKRMKMKGTCCNTMFIPSATNNKRSFYTP